MSFSRLTKQFIGWGSGRSRRRAWSRGRTNRQRQLHSEGLEVRHLLAAWVAQGPAPAFNGGVESIAPNNPVSGAIHTVLAHPTDPDLLYLGAVNGGIWRTHNATSSFPDWEPLTDQLPSLSISALEMDPADPNRLIAGIGRYSSFADSGAMTGLLLSENGGDTWTTISDPLLVGESFSGVALRGNTIVASASAQQLNLFGPTVDGGGVFRSDDLGATWQLLSAQFDEDALQVLNLTGLDAGNAFDLVGDPSSPERLYVSVGGQGIYRSDDTGATWINISSVDLALNGATTAANNNNTEMVVASNGRIYAAVLNDGQASYIGYSDTFGATWVEMDLPQTVEAGGNVGLNPRVKPGGQGAIHFSIAVSPDDPFTVYVGGDRQDGIPNNSIGARKFSGRLFRGDTRVAPTGAVPSPQWEHLTHSDLVGAIPGGGTRNDSAPHADSREMTFDANGDLIQGDDGGIYRRTSPENNLGDWFSLNGDLQVTEIHDIAYDSNSNIILAGTQDNGNVQQQASGSQAWEVPYIDSTFRFGGDGGDVAVDDTSRPGFSYRYMSAQFLGLFRRQLYDNNNNLIEDLVLPQPAGVNATFVTPLELNRVDQRRIVIAGANGYFESNNRGFSFTQIAGPGGLAAPGPDFQQNAIATGGSRNGVAEPDVLYVAAGNEVFVRTPGSRQLELTLRQFPGGTVQDIVLDPSDWTTAYVADRDSVYRTTNVGETWTDVTGNLQTLIPGRLRSLEFVPGAGGGGVAVGSDTGVSVMPQATPGVWAELGTGLPNALVYDMEYDATDDVLVVGTLGRGAWTLGNASVELVTASEPPAITISGTKWNDLNSDGDRDPGEPGAAGFLIYWDRDRNGTRGVGEPSAVTKADGSYEISGVGIGSNLLIREVERPGATQTFPVGGNGTPHIVSTEGGTSVTGVDFGNSIADEGGELPNGFDFSNADLSDSRFSKVSHRVIPTFHLGATNGVDDGVAFDGDLVPGMTTSVTVVVAESDLPIGRLQAWFDWNGDGSFDGPGEHVLIDRTVPSGNHTFMITVPATAVPGAIWTRFRLGYELGALASPNTNASAGEVEDYNVTVVGTVNRPPVAVDDMANTGNTSPETIRVLDNDSDPDVGDTIAVTGVDTTGTRGSVSLNGDGTINYDPTGRFDDLSLGETATDTFTYTIADLGGLTSTATVTVTVVGEVAPPAIVGFSVAFADPDSGESISSVLVGSNFRADIIVQDIRGVPTGVESAFTDVMFDSGLATVVDQGLMGISHGAAFPLLREGDALTTPGLIDEAGALRFSVPDGTEGDPTLVFSVELTADTVGTLTFTTDRIDDQLPPGSTGVGVDGMATPVPFNQIDYGIGTIEIISPTINLFTNQDPFDVDNNGYVNQFDALSVVDYVDGAHGPTDLSLLANFDTAISIFPDVDGDMYVTQWDALAVIDHLETLFSADTAAPASSTLTDNGLPSIPIASLSTRIEEAPLQQTSTAVETRPISTAPAVVSPTVNSPLSASLAAEQADDDQVGTILNEIAEDIAVAWNRQ